MKRQSVTLIRRFLDLTTELNNQDRLTVYDKILNHLFNEIPIETKGESDAVRVTLACLAPELRKAQAQYENGIISKKLATNSQGLLRPHDGSQPQANNKPEKGPNDNVIYNNKNMFLPINQSNHQSSKTQNYTFDAITNGSIEAYAHALEQILKQLQPINAMVSLRIAETLNKLVKSKSIKIKGEEVESVNVLKQIYENIRQVEAKELADVLQQMFDDIDTRKTSNKTKYEIISLYNLQTRLKKQPSKTTQNKSRKKDSWEREYSPEDFEDVYDDLDTCDI